MSQFYDSENSVNARFIEAYQVLKATGVVKNKTEFAKELDMPREYMSMIEANKRAVPEHYLINLTNCFNVSRVWLDTGEGNLFSGDAPRPSQSVRIGRIKGSGNAAGIGNDVTGGKDQDCQQKLAVALAEIEGYKREIARLEQMVDIFKSKS